MRGQRGRAPHEFCRRQSPGMTEPRVLGPALSLWTTSATHPRGTTTVILEDTYTLSNGLDIPKIGLGTWFIDNADAAQVVRDAAALGYRHIDTAQAYGNEAGVGEGIRSCGVPREQMFVTTKLAAEVKSFNEAARAIDKSLATTGFDYLDMMII